ncbi:Ceramide glucosyltransferase 1 [Bienertia sinuspersici]
MLAIESLDWFLFAASRACLSPVAIFVQIQGCLICLVLAFGWACAAHVRNRETKCMKNEMRHGNSFAFLCHDINELEHSNQVNLPRVTIVMPLKGFGEHNLHNWKSQITSLYGGSIEFLFIVESTEDPAYCAVSRLIKDFQDEIDAKIIVAGYSTTCSQKIHNQLSSPSSRVWRRHDFPSQEADCAKEYFMDRVNNWDVSKVGPYFEPTTSKIFATYIPKVDTENDCIWLHTKNVQYSIKTACWFDQRAIHPFGENYGKLECRKVGDCSAGNSSTTPSPQRTISLGGEYWFYCNVTEASWQASYWCEDTFTYLVEEEDKGILAGIHLVAVLLQMDNYPARYFWLVPNIISTLKCFVHCALTAEMEKNPEIFIQTGYPLDLPSGSLGSYCIYEYHMPCSMGFATGGKTFFLWGGCMMMHADDFRNDNYGVVSELRDGGYSDDMTLAAIAGAHKKLITSPPVAVFPHPLASDLSFSRYWNYLRKQTFVLESYVSKINWIMNRALFSVHCYFSWGFVAPYVMAVIHVAAAFRMRYKAHSIEEETILYGGWLFVGCLAICTAIELLSMWNLTRIEVHLCNLLSPEAPPLSLATYNWCLVFVAMLVDNFLYPISAFRSHFSQCINWSGIRYYLKDGKIYKVY